jgi:hypothetical protein
MFHLLLRDKRDIVSVVDIDAVFRLYTFIKLKRNKHPKHAYTILFHKDIFILDEEKCKLLNLPTNLMALHPFFYGEEDNRFSR